MKTKQDKKSRTRALVQTSPGHACSLISLPRLFFKRMKPAGPVLWKRNKRLHTRNCAKNVIGNNNGVGELTSDGCSLASLKSDTDLDEIALLLAEDLVQAIL